jgi:hypothetical protein
MTSFQSSRQRFAKFKADSIFLILTIVAIQFFSAAAWGLPAVIANGHHADRFAPNSIPGAPAGGNHVQISAVLNSSDSVGSPTISVEAVQGNTSITLDYIGFEHTLFQGVHLYNKFIDFDPALTGSWEIVPTDSTGTGPSAFTPLIADPEFLPLVENITVQGTPLGARVSWALPNLNGFDADAQVVRVMDATSSGFVFEQALPLQTTSYIAPAGVLEVGVDYVYWIILGDVEGPDAENLSWAASVPFHYTDVAESGDFNLNSTVDAADYVVWRNGLGTIYTQNDYGVWRSNFGKPAGSGSVGNPLGASAESLSAAVPEPAAVMLLAGPLIALIGVRRRYLRRLHRRSQVLVALNASRNVARLLGIAVCQSSLPSNSSEMNPR